MFKYSFLRGGEREMRRLLLNGRGQSTLEYAILIAVIVGALVGIQFLLKGKVSARMKSTADEIAGGEDQFFVPGVTVRTNTTTLEDPQQIVSLEQDGVTEVVRDPATTSTDIYSTTSWQD